MLRKHINDDTVWAVPVKETDVIGPCACPQEGCQATEGEGPYKIGNVILEEYGGHSGTYVTSRPCKCCDSNGFIAEGRRPYQNYCFSVNTRDVKTGYPSPYPMSRTLYNDPRLIENIKLFAKADDNKSRSKSCYIATAVFGANDARQVRELRAYRDRVLMPSAIGRVFVRAYYAVSPSVAKRLGHSSLTSNAARKFLCWLVERIEEPKVERKN
jgi:hypothetical protein